MITLAVAAAPERVRAQTDLADPLETINRGVFRFNMVLDGMVLEPVARGYRFLTPQFVRTGVGNFLDNLRAPVVVANDLIQGEPLRASDEVGRFMFNTVLGFGGILDVGGMLGMPPRHSEDFGQSLAVYGVGAGPYLMLPLLGPSNARDAVGRVVDFFIDPVTNFAPGDTSYVRSGAEVVRFREQNIETIDEMERTSIDFYAATRTLYHQYRLSEIRNGASAPADDVYSDDIYDEDIYDEDLYELEDPQEGDGL